MELFNWKGGDGRWRWWPVTGCLSSRGRCGRWLSAAIGAMECRRWVGGAASDSQQADGTGGRELRAKEVRVCGVPAWEREGGGRGKKKKMGSGWRGPMRYKKASRKEPWRWAGERASCSPGSPSPRSLGVRPVVGPPAGNGQQTGKGGTGVWRDGKAAEAVGMTMDAAGTGQLDATSLGEKRYFATKLRANNLAERPQRRRRPGYLQIPTLPISSPLPSPSLSLSLLRAQQPCRWEEEQARGTDRLTGQSTDARWLVNVVTAPSQCRRKQGRRMPHPAAVPMWYDVGPSR